MHINSHLPPPPPTQCASPAGTKSPTTHAASPTGTVDGSKLKPKHKETQCKNLSKDAKNHDFRYIFSKLSKIFRKRPNASERAQTHPNASERIRTGPNRSEHVRKLRKTCENVEQLRESIEKTMTSRQNLSSSESRLCL